MIRLGKLLKEILDEKLCVPDGVIEVGEDVYNAITEFLSTSSNILRSTTSDVEEIEIEAAKGYKILDYPFDKINIRLESVPSRPGEKLTWRGMAFSFQAELTKDYKNINVTSSNKEIDLIISFQSPVDATWQQVLDFLEGPDREKLISSVAHELKHAYDAYKKPTRSALGAIQYRLLSPSVGLPEVDQFLYNIYYTSLIESIVRPTEVASFLKYKKIDKKDFLNVLKETDAYKNLKNAEAVSYDKMIDAMVSEPRYVESISDWFRNQTPINPDTLTDKEIITKFLDNWFLGVKTEMKLQFRKMVKNDPVLFFRALNFPSGVLNQEQEKAINEFDKEVDAFKNSEAFFRYQEKKVKAEATKSIRKLAKLYDYL
jgi:hypothetical protein